MHAFSACSACRYRLLQHAKPCPGFIATNAVLRQDTYAETVVCWLAPAPLSSYSETTTSHRRDKLVKRCNFNIPLEALQARGGGRRTFLPLATGASTGAAVLTRMACAAQCRAQRRGRERRGELRKRFQALGRPQVRMRGTHGMSVCRAHRAGAHGEAG